MTVAEVVMSILSIDEENVLRFVTTADGIKLRLHTIGDLSLRFPMPNCENAIMRIGKQMFLITYNKKGLKHERLTVQD